MRGTKSTRTMQRGGGGRQLSAWEEMQRRAAEVNERLGLRPEDFPDPGKGEGHVRARVVPPEPPEDL